MREGLTAIMLTPVVCFSCGTSIGHIAELFRKLREKRVREDLDGKHISPEMSAIRLDSNLDMTDRFNILQISQSCCRTHLASAAVVSDYY